MLFHLVAPGPCLDIKTIFPSLGDSHVKDKTVTRPSYLKHGDPHSWQDNIFILRQPLDHLQKQCSVTNNVSTAQCKTAVSPSLTHWRCCSLAQSHQYHSFHYTNIPWASWHLKSVNNNCLFNSFSRFTLKNTSFAFLILCEGIHLSPVYSPHTVMWKTLPCHYFSTNDVISNGCTNFLYECQLSWNVVLWTNVCNKKHRKWAFFTH